MSIADVTRAFRPARANRALAAFSILASAAFLASAARADATRFEIQRNDSYVQTGPTTEVEAGAAFQAQAFTNPANGFTSATLNDPGPDSPTSLPAGGDGASFGYATFFSSLAALNAADPVGAYAFSLLNSATGATTGGSLDDSGDHYASSLPAFSAASFEALSRLAPGIANTLTFDSFTPDPAAGWSGTVVLLFDNSIPGGRLVLSDMTSPSSTNVTLPAGTLVAGDSYVIDLVFVNTIGADPTAQQVFNLGTQVTFQEAPAAPEPSTWSLFGVGIAGLALSTGARGRRRSAAI